jgi:hypothetical protein
MKLSAVIPDLVLCAARCDPHDMGSHARLANEAAAPNAQLEIVAGGESCYIAFRYLT